MGICVFILMAPVLVFCINKCHFCRPFFTYWITFVHILVMIVVSSVYGFAPIGLDYKTEEALVGKREQTDRHTMHT